MSNYFINIFISESWETYNPEGISYKLGVARDFHRPTDEA